MECVIRLGPRHREYYDPPARGLRGVASRYARGRPGLLRVWRRRRARLPDAGRRQDTLRDAAWNEQADPSMARLEAVLFLAKEPLNSRKLSRYANLADGTAARTLVRRLNQRYDHFGSAFRVEDFAGGMQLVTRSKFASWLRRLGHVPTEERLSAPSLETLAVVAYRQPVLRADIEAIRGVNCGELLRQLMERDLVRIAGRGDELGRPYLYGTTKRFLELFGLRTIRDLPYIERFRGPQNDASVTRGDTKEVN